MIASEAARRYARAMFELGNETGTLEAIVADFNGFSAAYASSSELRLAAADPMVALDAKRAIFSEIADRLSAQQVSKRCLLLLSDRRRVAALPQIATALRELTDKQKGLSRAVVTSARPLSEEQAAALKLQLDRLTGKATVLDVHVDPTLIAGLVVRIGDTVFDGTVRARLHEAKQKLLPN
jgi:F-type H+-transporting ATPase subunit delta